MQPARICLRFCLRSQINLLPLALSVHYYFESTSILYSIFVFSYSVFNVRYFFSQKKLLFFDEKLLGKTTIREVRALGYTPGLTVLFAPWGFYQTWQTFVIYASLKILTASLAVITILLL